MSPQPGSYNWTQDAEEEGLAGRMSREALIYACSPPEETWELLESGDDYREHLDEQTAGAVAEIEQHAGRSLKFRQADVGRGATGFGAAVEIVETVAIAGVLLPPSGRQHGS